MQLAALQVLVLWLLVVLVVLPVAAGTQLPGHSLVAQHEAWGTCTLLLSFPGVCIWERPGGFLAPMRCLGGVGLHGEGSGSRVHREVLWSGRKARGCGAETFVWQRPEPHVGEPVCKLCEILEEKDCSQSPRTGVS